MPRIWEVGIMNERRTSNIEQQSVSRDCRASVSDANSQGRRFSEPRCNVMTSHRRKTTSLPKGHSRFALRTNLVSCPPMQNVAAPHKLTDASPAYRRHVSLAFALSVLFVGALWLVLCRELSGEWSVNEQYNFGWFVPFLALYLFWLRWQDRPAAEIPNLKSQIPNSAAFGL